MIAGLTTTGCGDDAAGKRDASPDGATASEPPTARDFDSESTADRPVPCAAPLCGDGEVNECATVPEQCDGENLGGLSCESLGFARGSLACSPQCTADAASCDPCEADDRIARCNRLETLAGFSYGLGLAWRDGVLVIATAVSEEDALFEGALHPLHLVVLDEDLEALGQAHEPGPTKAWIIGLVAVPNGFLVAYVDGWSGRGAPCLTQHLDARGVPDAEPVPHAGVGLGMLIARADGGPLLVANATPESVPELPDGGVPPGPNPPRSARSVSAILLDEQGQEVWSVATAADTVVGELSTGTYTGDGFLFATEAIPSHAYAVQHVSLDGTVTLDVFGIPSADPVGVYYPQLAWDGASAWLTWSDSGADVETCSEPGPVIDGGFLGGICVAEPSELRWAKLDGRGRLIEGPNAVRGVVRSPAAFIADAAQRVLVSGEAPTPIEGVPSSLHDHGLSAAMTPTAVPIPLVDDDSVRRFSAVFGPDGSVFVTWTRSSTRYGLLGVARLEL